MQLVSDLCERKIYNFKFTADDYILHFHVHELKKKDIPHSLHLDFLVLIADFFDLFFTKMKNRFTIL